MHSRTLMRKYTENSHDKTDHLFVAFVICLQYRRSKSVRQIVKQERKENLTDQRTRKPLEDD
jgi:hypothetical protein